MTRIKPTKMWAVVDDWGNLIGISGSKDILKSEWGHRIAARRARIARVAVTEDAPKRKRRVTR